MDTIPPCYRFGTFRLDPSRRLLECAGVAVPVAPRGYDLLLVLLEGRDRVLSRSEIMQRVWPGLIVEEHNLSVQISKLRRVLGDTGDEAQIIATIPGRGYRFVAPLGDGVGLATDLGSREVVTSSLPVEAVRHPLVRHPDPLPAPPSAAAAQPRRTGFWAGRLGLGAASLLGAAGLALWRATSLPPVPALSIVVMPLRDLSDRPGQTYLADAISDDLTTELAHLPASTVIARETADSYKGRAVPVTLIGRELHVRYLLEGSLRAEGKSLHVNAQLIDTASGGHISSQVFDVPREDPDQARDMIVRRIASALDVDLIDAESARGLRDRPHDPTALDLFFQARSILDHDDSLAGFRAAQSLLEHAISLQPTFIDALAELATMLSRKTLSVDDPDEETDRAHARDDTARALALSPRHSVALAARAQLFYVDGDIDKASYAARDALEAEPSNLGALAVLARCAMDRGHLEDAAQSYERILRLNPLGASNKPRLLMLGTIRLIQGRVADAIDLAQRATAGDPPPSPDPDINWDRAEGALTTLVAARAMAGQTQQAQDLYARLAELRPHRSVWRIGAAANRPLARLPGFATFLDALHVAGMPVYADEHADDHVAPTSTPLPANSYYLPTPRTIPGAETIDTPGLRALLRQASPPIILDIGPGAAVMPGAIIRGPAELAEGDDTFLDAALARARPAPDTPIVVLANGTYGSLSYNGALHLVSAGYRHVIWYRGGEEAWAASGAPFEDKRQ